MMISVLTMQQNPNPSSNLYVQTSMEDSKSSTTSNDDENDHFLDALDEFPFYDCLDTVDPGSISSISEFESIAANGGSPSEPPALAALRRRRSFAQHTRKDLPDTDSKDSDPNSSVSFDFCDTTTATIPKDRKYRFSRNLKENGRENGNSDPFKVRFNEELKEKSTVTTVNDERIDDSITVDSPLGVVNESSLNFLFLLVGLVIKAIGFQINLLVSFFTFPSWLLYCSYMFVIDPFQAVRRGREYLKQKLLRLWGVICETVSPFIYEWLKEQKSLWKLAFRLGWGLLSSVSLFFILVSLLASAFVISGFVMRFLVEEPIQMKETLNFDYTKNSPADFVPIISCSAVSCDVNCKEKIDVGKLGGARVIPPKHKLQVTVSLTLPESDYNRNLGMFQVRVDFLTVNGKAIASSRRPCMLHFKSEPIRHLLTFLKMAPILAGYFSESQTLNVNFRGFTEGDMPTACLRVIIEQRAEFRPGAGIPEIYGASLTLESEQPLLKRFLWYWKKTIFIWTSMMMFTMELLFTLLCYQPFIIQRVRLMDGSANSSIP